MTTNSGQNPKKFFIPPNMLAFIAGILLALLVGVVFRKVIDSIHPGRATALRAQAGAQENPTGVSASSSPESSKEVSLNTVTAETSEAAEKASAQAKTNEQTKSAAETKAGTETKSGQLQKNAVSFEDSEVATLPSGEVDYLAWRRLFRSVEEMAGQQGLKITSVTLTPRYRHQAKGLAITRGQFLDVVSRRVPANLPTRQTNQGLVLAALSTIDFDNQQFSKVVSDSGIRLENLCRDASQPINTDGSARITVILTNTPEFFKCLQNWLATNPKLKDTTELSLVGLTRGPTFFGSITSERKLISLQMWNPDWLLDNTVGMDETGRETPTQKRSLRMANVTRALGQPSDVRMLIPASTRSLVGPLIEPKDPTPAKPLVIGNFALVPSHMPRGTLIATAYTNPGQDRSKSASVTPPSPGRARALVLATQGKKLQFMTVTKE